MTGSIDPAALDSVMAVAPVTATPCLRLEPDPKVVEQYQPFVIQPSVRAEGLHHGMDRYCPAGT
jgi:hypothetical protein